MSLVKLWHRQSSTKSKRFPELASVILQASSDGCCEVLPTERYASNWPMTCFSIESTIREAKKNGR